MAKKAVDDGFSVIGIQRPKLDIEKNRLPTGLKIRLIKKIDLSNRLNKQDQVENLIKEYKPSISHI